jgi:hypothetical protein
MATAALHSYSCKIGQTQIFVPLIMGLKYEQQLDIEYFSMRAKILESMGQLVDMASYFEKCHSHDRDTAIWLKGIAWQLSTYKMLGEGFSRWGVSQTDIDSWLGGRPRFEDVTESVVVDDWDSNWIESVDSVTHIVVDRGAVKVDTTSSGAEVFDSDVQCELATGSSLLPMDAGLCPVVAEQLCPVVAAV